MFIVFKAIRTKQWLKNLAVFSVIFFTGQLYNHELLKLSGKAFVVFCLLSSASYLLNDIIDKKRDQQHPFKKFRPIASGKLTVSQALEIFAFFVSLAFFLSYSVSKTFLVLALFYLVLQISYSLILKNIAVIDILVIATAYIIRVYAGEVATGFHLSIWLTLTVISLSLFLAIGKRRCELTLLQRADISPLQTRNVFLHYQQNLLDAYTAVFATATFINYSFYTFLAEKLKVPSFFFQGLISEFFSEVPERKLLMSTIPFVIYGLMRYMQLIYEKAQGESPERVLLSDKPLLLTVLVWSLTVWFIIYGIGSA